MTVDEILDKMEANEKAKTSKSEVTQIVTKANGQESVSRITMYSMDEGDKSIMIYNSPARIKGMKMLMLNEGDDIWFYSPRTARVRKIASHQKNQSVNNSDFSYEDMATSDFREEYTCTLLGEEKMNGLVCYKLQMIPKSNDKSYSKILFWVDKEKSVGTEAHYYDKEENLWKKLFMRDVVNINNYWTPKTIEMRNVQKQSTTVMKMDKIEYDIEVDPMMFSERYLKQ